MLIVEPCFKTDSSFRMEEWRIIYWIWSKMYSIRRNRIRRLSLYEYLGTRRTNSWNYTGEHKVTGFSFHSWWRIQGWQWRRTIDQWRFWTLWKWWTREGSLERLTIKPLLDESSCLFKPYSEQFLWTEIGIALAENVIVVNFNYRLGPFGFLANID